MARVAAMCEPVPCARRDVRLELEVVMRLSRREEPVVITDAEPSLEDEQRVRKRVYTVLMVVHLAGFTAAGVLADVWWVAIALVMLTGPLPWIAVVIANSHRVGNELARRWQHHPRGAARALRDGDSRSV